MYRSYGTPPRRAIGSADFVGMDFSPSVFKDVFKKVP
jgi:hypothetical protein